jgi:7-cyano-7-deazaguanine synthase
MSAPAKKAVVILSGGLDSTTCMGIAKDKGYELYPITFDYGQRHRIEIGNARKVAEHYGVKDRHKIIRLDFLREFGGSALTDDAIDVPDMTAPGAADAARSEIPVTYVPGRNLLFLSIATSYAEVIGAEAIYIGVNALDYSGYPDCRPEFIAKVEDVIKYATKAGVEGRPIAIETPLIHWTKADIIREGMRLGVPYELSTSCYNGREAACGVCDSCRLRLKGFAEAGYTDPIPYEAR